MRSIPAPATSPIGPHKQNLPHRGTDTFVGREDELRDLHERLTSGKTTAIRVALHGMGGVGKTELALQYAWGRQADYALGVCWLDGRGEEPQIQFARFAAEYWNVRPPEGLEPEERFKYILQNLPRGNALIVLDDYPGEFPGFLRNLPQSFRLLVTTREEPGQGFQTISLAVLSQDAALNLLGELRGRENSIVTQQADGISLCKWLGFLPLALELVGNYLRPRPELSLARMQERLDKKGLKHVSLAPEKGSGIRTSRHKSIWAALELSREVLSEQGLELASLLSQLGQAKIPLGLIEAITEQKSGNEYEDETWEDARTELMQLSLLERPEAGYFRLHPLVREYFQSSSSQWETSEENRRTVACILSREARRIPEPLTLKEAVARAELVPHWEWACESLTDVLEADDLIWPFEALDRYYQLYNNLSRAEYYRKACLAVCEELLGEGHPSTAVSLNHLADLYQAQGKYKIALPVYIRALEISKKVFGENDPSTSAVMNNLAALYSALGQDEEALSLYRLALDIREQSLGKEDTLTAISLDNLASLYRKQKNYEAALPLHKRALAIFAGVLGEEHPSTATSLNNLAVLYDAQGNYQDALSLYERALSIRENSLGEGHLDTATSLNNLAMVYRRLENYDDALPLYERALDVYDSVLGGEHPTTRKIRNNLEKLKELMG